MKNLPSSASRPFHIVDYDVLLHFFFFCTYESDIICFHSRYDLGAAKVKILQMFYIQHLLVYLQLEYFAELILFERTKIG